MAKPTDKITVTLSRSDWNLYIAKMTSQDIEVRNKAAIELAAKMGLD